MVVTIRKEYTHAMLAKPTRPIVGTMIDLRLNRPERPAGDSLFQGWGVAVPGNRFS